MYSLMEILLCMDFLEMNRKSISDTKRKKSLNTKKGNDRKEINS